MADTVYIRYLDDVYIQIDADKSALYSIKERFTFKVPGYQFTPSYKSGYWDGSISLLNLRNRTIYSGLLEEIKEFCKESEFELEIEDHPRFHQNELSLHEAKEFIESLKIPERFELRDYQIQTFVRSIRETRSLVVSPTASGKSYLIYLLLRYLNKKTLIIVPNLNLVHQMYKDFDEYGFDVENNCHKIYAEQEKYDVVNIEIELEDGSILLVPGNQSITLINNKKKEAKDLTELDEISDKWINTTGKSFLRE